MPKILVWLGAYSDHWSKTRAQAGDAWVESTVLETGDDGSVKAQRDANAKHCAWVKSEHWKEVVADE